MRLLLDTHVVVWVLSDPGRLAAKTLAALEGEENRVFVSVVTPWELAIKGPREELHVPNDLEVQVERNHFKWLSIELKHTDPIGAMRYHHRDPFDRMLVAQALTEGLTIVTADRKLREYPVSLMPAI